MDDNRGVAIASEFSDPRGSLLIRLMVRASPIAIGCVICLLAEDSGDDAVPGLYVTCKYIAGPLYSVLFIWLAIHRLNRCGDPRLVTLPASAPGSADELNGLTTAVAPDAGPRSR